MTHAPAEPSRPSVTVGPHGLRLGGEELPFLSGAMHYFRVPRRDWGRCLDAIADLGLPLVESYVPWSVHEREEGRLDFGDGPVVDGFERDLDGFLDACAERGLRVLLRPGPGVNAELTGFGYPARILRDERCLALGNRGNRVILPTPPRCFAVPSYASERFLEQAGAWLRGFGDHVRPRLWPDGPVVGVQVDNELSLFFRSGAYDQDYHPDAVELYREFLAQRYPDGLPAVYGDGPAEPPRRFAADSPQELLRQLDWVAFKEHLVLRALGQLARVLRMVGLDRVVLCHNFPAGWTGAPCGLAAAEQTLDLVGLDLHLRPQDLAAVRRAALGLAATRLPVALELACGTWPWWFPQRWSDQRRVALTLLMHGAKGFNLYMAVDRDRWYGAPIGGDGQRREHFGEIQRLVAAVKAAVRLDRPVPVAVLKVQEYERLTVASSLADPVPPLALDLLGLGPGELCSAETAGLGGPMALDYANAVAAATATLDRTGVAYHLVDSDLPAERLARYRVALVPLFDFVDTGLLERLGAFVAAGGVLLLVGRLPRLDGQMRPLERAIPPHQLVEPGSELEAALVAALGQPARRASAAGVEVVVHGDPSGPRVVYVANRTDGSQTTAVALDGPDAPEPEVRDALLGQPVDLRCIRLAPHEVRMLRVTPTQSDGGAP